ncbi:MAG: nitronate monooxygenase [Clostridiales bacterium]|nr:nitronate monooxygenase [Clostridiales bacterium]
MKITEMKELVIGNLTAKLPIIQGGMGIGISLSGLASAVANQGGIGVISTAGIGMSEPDYISNYIEANIRALKREIRLAREKTSGLIGVNIMVAMTNFEQMVRASIEEGIDFIFAGAGLPLSLPKYLTEFGKTKLVPIVSSARAARILVRRWIDKFGYMPDAFIVEGPLAGGHLGFSEEQISDPAYSLEKIVPEVINEMMPFEKTQHKSIPVIAAGGIYSGGDVDRFMRMGAAGVQMATRFVTTKECDASDAFKDTYIRAKKDDICIIASPVGLPGRAITNRFLEDVQAGNKKPFTCPFHCISTCDRKNCPYCISIALMNAKKGQMSGGFAFAGANAFLNEKIVSVKSLIDSIRREFSANVLGRAK